MTRTGALGRPELATSDKGEKLLDVIAQKIADFVREFANWEREDAPKPTA
jgi:creatinine amidohydrolase/Fe(II)-dependent formamide hydrolase-like protein